jgi:predicted CXXCH cytochrome family protein
LGLGVAWAKSPHGGLSCGGCHAARDQVKPATAPLLVAPQERTCGECHEKAVVVGHPVGITPDRPLPSEYPLNWKGQVVCSTCHDLHDGGPARLRGDKVGEELCLACHSSDFFDKMADRGLSLRGSAHYAAVPARHLSIDSFSYRCADCHEARVSLPNQEEWMRGVPARFGGLLNHPIGAVYNDYAFRGGYRPAHGIPKEMLLPEGQVSCLTCHKAYSQNHGELLRPVGGLCDQCHDK